MSVRGYFADGGLCRNSSAIGFVSLAGMRSVVRGVPGKTKQGGQLVRYQLGLYCIALALPAG